MRCPNCGADAGRAPFCPQCGADLSMHQRRRRAIASKVDRRLRHFASAITILLAAISVILVVLSAVPVEDTGSVDPGVPDDGPAVPDGALVLDSGYIVLSEGYLDAGFSGAARVSYDRGERTEELVTTLSAESLEGVQRIMWMLRCDSDGSVSYIPKSLGPDVTFEDIGRLTWIVSSHGEWTLTADLYAADGTLIGARSGSFAYYGDASVSYEWKHGGRTLSLTYTVSLKDYLAATGYASGRSSSSADAARGFVSPEQVSELEQLIWSAYYGAFGGTRATDYAACLVEFVGSGFRTADDILTYGTATYWAYPVETLYSGQGDSGDLCVLASSLLEAAGFSSALARLPGMWAVGVPVISGQDATEGAVRIVIDEKGIMYWITSLSPFLGIGLVPDVYGYEDGAFMYYGEAAGAGYGMTVLP